MKERPRRVSTLLKKEIGRILTEDIEDKRIKLISVIDVDVATDFSVARVYVSIYGDDKEEVLKLLNDKICGFIKKKLLSILNLKRLPKIKFLLDTSIEKSFKIQNIINNLNKIDNLNKYE